MRYWLSSNKDFAEQQTLYRVIGFLQGYKECAEKVSVDTVLNYIETSQKEIHDHLNKAFPEYAEL